MVDQIAHVLRPGGLLDLSEFDFHVYDKDYQRVEYETNQTASSSSWCCTWMARLGAAIKGRGGDLDAATHLRNWVSSNPAYEEVEYKEFFIPFAPHRESWEKATNAEKKLYDVLREDVCVRIITP